MITPAFAPTATERVLPRLALDFTTGTLDPRVTVTRALNTATRINSSGLLVGVNADLPRFDYDPVTLAPKGLLIEESRINLTTYSNDFSNAVWLRQAFGTASIPALTPNFAISPDGTQNASRLQMTLNGGTTTADYAVQQHTSTTVVSGASYSYSIWLKSNTASNYIVLARDDGASTGTSVLWTVTPTWQRFSYTATTSATGSIGPKLWLRGGLGTSTSADLLIYGAQLEAGAFATSYIPNLATGTTTRNADVVSMTGANFSSWYSQAEGAFAVEYSRFQNVDFGILIEAKGSSTNTTDRINMSLTSAAEPRSQIFIGGSSILDTINTFGALPTSTTVRTTLAYKSGSNGAARLGGAVSSSTTAFATPAYTELHIGGTNNQNYGPIANAYMNGHIRTIRFWPQRLTNAELQAFSK